MIANSPVTSFPYPTALMSLLDNVRKYDTETSNTIRLVPTEGVMSPLQKLMYTSIQNERYLHAPPEYSEKAIRYPDIHRLQVTYDHSRELARSLFDGEYVIPDFLAGMHAMALCLLAFTGIGETILCIDPRHGGHESTKANGLRLGRAVKYLPFDEERHVVDVSALDKQERPKLIYLDHSNMLFWSDMQRLKETYPDATLIVDISQVMALVCGRTLHNPLSAGADLIVGSTHKSLNGPQKAIAITNQRKAFEQLREHCRSFVSSNHMASIAALAVCFHEFVAFGERYAEQLVENANSLGEALIDRGIPVYLAKVLHRDGQLTHTQHIWIDCKKMGWDAEAAVKKLYKSGLVVNTLYLCRGGERDEGAKGLRLGTTEVTRLGLRRAEMITIASSIAAALQPNADEGAIAGDMAALRRRFDRVQYCYEIPPFLRRSMPRPNSHI
jgi:glycine hydroxymethyltransferase